MIPDLAERLARLSFPIRTRRLELALPDASRDRELIELLRDGDVSAWTTIPFPYGPKEASEFRRRAPRARRKGTDLALQIVRSNDGALVGGIGLHSLTPARSRGELGYWIGRPYRGRGFALEASRRMVELGFRDLGLHRIEAHVFLGNRASAGVLRAAGFRREGWLRGSFPWRGGFRDEWLFARLAPARRPQAPGPAARGRSVPPTRTR